MVTVAVTGGIGSGKSTVARLLRERGAIVVDSDRLARDVVAPGTDGFAEVVRDFGDGVVLADGSLDRPALASIVFSDPAARARLEGIIHPRVRARFTTILAGAADGAVVVNDIPILRTADEARAFDHVIVVVATEPVRIGRLIARGLTEDDARARIRAQITDNERVLLADDVIDNSHDLTALNDAVDKVWNTLRATGS